MRLKPFFTYYGGKWRSAARMYPAPINDHIVEPFAGAAGYALTYSDRQVILCDKSPIVCHLWRYLISSKQREILGLPDLEDGQSVDDLRIAQEAKWLIGFWLNKGTASPCKRPSSWMLGKTRPKSYWGPEIRQRIARQLSHIRHWKVIEGDYVDCPSQDATWFVDPPYQVAGNLYPYGSKKICYASLAHWCRMQRSQVIVCENSGANWLPFYEIGESKNQRKKERNESVWIYQAGAL